MGSNVGKAKRTRVLERDNYICHYCGNPLGGYRGETIDHLVPRSRGGTNDESNLVACCVWCNRAKGSHLKMPNLTKKKRCKLRPQERHLALVPTGNAWKHPKKKMKKR